MILKAHLKNFTLGEVTEKRKFSVFHEFLLNGSTEWVNILMKAFLDQVKYSLEILTRLV